MHRPKTRDALRISCIADTHLLAPHAECDSLFPERLRRLSPRQKSAIYNIVSTNVERAYDACMQELQRSTHDIVVHLGDITGGIGHPPVKHLALRCVADLQNLGVPVYYCIGNHDIESTHAKATDRELIDAFEGYEGILGSLSWHHLGGDVLSLGICSPLAAYHGRNRDLMRKKKTQENFLRDTLSSHQDLPWTLYLHNPFDVRHLLPVIAPHLRRCRTIIAGHLHRPSFGWWIRVLARMPVGRHVLSDPLFIKALKKTVVCPSVAPLWYKGYGFLRVTCRNGHVRRRHAMIPALGRGYANAPITDISAAQQSTFSLMTPLEEEVSSQR